MKIKKSNPFVLLSFILLSKVNVNAQVNINSSGGDGTGSGGSFAFSIGQITYNTYTGSSGSVLQGVQQTYEIFTNGINETDLTISISTYPNPSSDNLTIEISDYNNEILNYQLFDFDGKLLTSGFVTSSNTKINMVAFAQATYFININNQMGKKVQSFKIIKK